jgi:hypothetical protein
LQSPFLAGSVNAEYIRNPLQLVKLYAGPNPNAKGFTVHKDFACHYSPVLKTAFNSDFLEGQTQEYRFESFGEEYYEREESELDGENEEVVRLLVHWLYTQDLDLIQLQEDFGDWESDLARKEDVCLVKLWVLADKLLIPQLQNSTLEALEKIQKKFNIVATYCLGYVSINISKESGLRRWFVQFISSLGAEYFNEDDADEVPHDILLDIIVLLYNDKQKIYADIDLKEYLVEVPLH